MLDMDPGDALSTAGPAGLGWLGIGMGREDELAHDGDGTILGPWAPLQGLRDGQEESIHEEEEHPEDAEAADDVEGGQWQCFVGHVAAGTVAVEQTVCVTWGATKFTLFSPLCCARAALMQLRGVVLTELRGVVLTEPRGVELAEAGSGGTEAVDDDESAGDDNVELVGAAQTVVLHTAGMRLEDEEAEDDKEGPAGRGRPGPVRLSVEQFKEVLDGAKVGLNV